MIGCITYSFKEVELGLADLEDHIQYRSHVPLWLGK